MLVQARPLIIALLAVVSYVPTAVGQQVNTVNIRPRVAVAQPGLPTVQITVDRKRVPLGDEVTFTLGPASVVLDPRFTVTLDFGDGRRTSTHQTRIVHLYGATGYYTASVSVAPANRIPTPLPPNPFSRPVPGVSLSAAPTPVVAGLTVTLTATLTFADPGIKYRFVFGDNSRPTEWQSSSQTTHAYSPAGTYLAYVGIGRTIGGSTTQVGSSKSQRIEVKSAQAPTISLIASPTTVDTARLVSFIAQVDPRVSNALYRFSFGDGSPPTALQASPLTTHPYSSAGRYPAYVEVGQFISGRFNSIARSTVREVTVTSAQPLVTPRPTPTPRITPTAVARPTPTPGQVSGSASPGGAGSSSPGRSKASSSPGASSSNDPFGLEDNWWKYLLLMLLLLVVGYQTWKLLRSSGLTFHPYPDPGVSNLEHAAAELGLDFQLVLSPNVSEAEYLIETDETSFIRSERSSNG